MTSPALTVPARYSGVCPECGERWQPGDPIRSFETIEHTTVWVHAVCPDAPDPLGVRPGERARPDCWLIHPLTADCDEW